MAKINPGQFIKEARAELAKVIWPTRTEAVKLTALVIVISLAVAVFIGGIDYFLSQVLKVLVK
jgi:preprotein translocase subunit SecE